MAELDEDDYGLPFGGLGRQEDKSKKKSKKGDKSQTEMVAELDNELDTIGMNGIASVAGSCTPQKKTLQKIQKTTALLSAA